MMIMVSIRQIFSQFLATAHRGPDLNARSRHPRPHRPMTATLRGVENELKCEVVYEPPAAAYRGGQGCAASRGR